MSTQDEQPGRTNGSSSGASDTEDEIAELIAAFESASARKLALLRRQLDLDIKRFNLAVEEQRESRADRAREREARQRERELAREERDREMEYRRKERDRELEDRRLELEEKIKRDQRIHAELEERRKERQAVVTQWIQEGRSVSEIQILAQAMFG